MSIRLDILYGCLTLLAMISFMIGLSFTISGGISYSSENEEILVGKGSESMCIIKAITATSGDCFVNQNCNGTDSTFNVWFDTGSGCNLQNQRVPYGLNIDPFECQLERVIPCWSVRSVSSIDSNCDTKFVIWQRTEHNSSTKSTFGIGLAFLGLLVICSIISCIIYWRCHRFSNTTHTPL
ncbi:MAG: hypothetical protein Terrestrivirus1_222 [Terrestrivirus sp.]|uniref:Uncharacterized protein n=1 Tax=Terrestrivirus sp. TaxID=2487775 RepID=A0A3G4ZKI0_9VIRU|nr:MAG: hypothetical protein Terrestrivirus1_222 [Terrestrivirus sp.]